MGSCKIPVINDLNDLIAELQRLFQEDQVDVDHVQDVMLAYRSSPKDWKKYAFFDRHR
jgi:cysteine dioxygenase